MVEIRTPFIQLCAISLLARLGYQMARSPVLPRFAQDLGAAPELLGLIVAASTITGVFVKLPVSALSDVLGRRKMLVLGTFCFAAPPFLYLLVQNPVSLLLLRFLHGFATAIFSPVAAAYVARLAGKGRGEKLGWFASAGDIGGTVGPLVGGLVLHATASYPMTYLLVGILGVFPFLLVLRLPDDPGSSERKDIHKRWPQFKAGIAEVLANRQVLIASCAEAVMYVGYGALLGFLPPYAKGVGLNDAEIGIILGGQLATTMAAKPIGGRLSDHLGRKRVILIGLLVCAGILPLIALTKKFALLMVLSALFGLGVAVVTPSTTALVADLVKTGRMGSAMGVFGTIWDIGEASGPILTGFLIASLGYPPAFTLIASLITGGALIFAILVRDPHTVYGQV
ncbi:MAG: MFS transporter [Candidatus Methylomirabilis sp.]